ncbi:MAG TPA: cytochrome c oxidase assembly protein [Acidimicrobiales bacterium]|nr:cytochrome c oxidase assembly protein [Acidimicrobiales bacterium]
MSKPDPWAFHAHPEVWVLMVGIIVAYWYLVRRGPVSKRQAASFLSGWAVLWVGADYPIHDLGENYLFSVHMFQHMLFSLVAPGLLILGIPGWLQHKLWGTGRRAAALRALARPLVAGALYTVWLLFSHWPAALNLALRHEPVHFLFHLALFSTASLMWFPVLNRNPELPTLSEVGRMLYIFLQSVMPTVPAAFFTFAERPVYEFYARVPRPFAMNAVSDQQLAGAIMKVWGGLILWGIIAVMFFRWTARDEKERLARRRVLTWDEVQAELERTSAPSP